MSGTGDYSLNASKDIGMGVTDLALACGSEPVVDAVCTAVVGSARIGLVFDAASDREDRSSDATLGTHDSRSLKKTMAASCALISTESCHIATYCISSRTCLLHASETLSFLILFGSFNFPIFSLFCKIEGHSRNIIRRLW